MALTDVDCVENSDVVRVICKRMDVLASDLVLDSPARRKPNGARFRRALVHDESDGLSINFAGDYPGGVTLVNVAEVFPQVKPATKGPYPTLVVRGAITYETEQFTGTEGQGSIPGEHHTITVNVDELFDAHQSEILALRARIEALEAKIG